MAEEKNSFKPKNSKQHEKKQYNKPLQEGDFTRKGSIDRPIRNGVEIEIDYKPKQTRPKKD